MLGQRPKNGILKHIQKTGRSVFSQVVGTKSKLLSVFLLADAYKRFVGWRTNFKINMLLVGWWYVDSIKRVALEMISSQLRKRNLTEGKKNVSAC